jgi:hypothetical protein
MRNKRVPSKFSTIFCNIEWHCFEAGTLSAATAAASIYHIAYRIHKNSGTFRVGIPTMAEYLGIDDKSVRSAYHFLITKGFFVVLREVQGSSTEYAVVNHEEWAHAHPGKCCQKLDVASTDDSLARALHGITGKNFWQQYLTAIRRHGFNDEQIIAYAKGVWAAHRDNPKGGSFHTKLQRHLSERVSG